MKTLIALYCEGFDNKAAVFTKTKEGIKIHRVISVKDSVAITDSAPSEEIVTDLDLDGLGDDLSFAAGDAADAPDSIEETSIASLANALKDINLNSAEFIPAVSEPVVNYHLYEGNLDVERNKLIDAVITDIQNSKNVMVSRDSIDGIKISDTSLFTVFLEGDLPCVNVINSLAAANKRKYYKIPTIKSAEISLAYYVSKNFQLFPQDYTLIVYTGKEYSRLIFMEGQKLKHIGTRLEIGTQNLHTYDVYFSKILLEMENGDIPKLDNVILCGEDNSENFILSFYSTFPDANVNALTFDNIELDDIDDASKNSISSYAIPIAVALEYYDEQEKNYSGINILPRYIQENQKILQFGWHSYVIFAVIFLTTFFFTYKILSNTNEILTLSSKVDNLTALQIQNEALISEINVLSDKINNFDQSQSILDSATAGTEIWSKSIKNMSDFVNSKRNFWLTKIERSGQSGLKLTGYSLSRVSLTEFAEKNQPSILQSVLYEPLREANTYSFNITFNSMGGDSLNTINAVLYGSEN